jgi:hypothetical protein
VRNDRKYALGGTGKDEVLPVGFMGMAEDTLLGNGTNRFRDGK